MGDIFLSYSRADQSVVAPLVRKLERHGFSVWWDGHIPPGEDFRSFIDVKLNEADAICVIWSSESVQSRWVTEEAEEGARRANLIPISIDGSDIPRGFRSFQAAQLNPDLPTEKYDAEFDKLVARLQQVSKRDESVKPKRRKLPSPLSYRSARNQNLVMTVVFTALTLAFVSYDFISDAQNFQSLWFRLGVVLPSFFVFALGYFLARKAWHIWLLNVLTIWAATVLVILQVRQFGDPQFSETGFGTTLNVIAVLVGGGTSLVHSTSSRVVALTGAVGLYALVIYLQGASGIAFWATAISQPALVAVFVCLGFYLRDRHAR